MPSRVATAPPLCREPAPAPVPTPAAARPRARGRTHVAGQQKKEAIGINSSLLVLGKCISALVKGHSHVPYYESALTMLLKGALGGNSPWAAGAGARGSEGADYWRARVCGG